jgi:hypothetical protein
MRIPVITGLENNNIAGFEGRRRCWISLHSTRFWRLVAGPAKKGKPRRKSEFGTIVRVRRVLYQQPPVQASLAMASSTTDNITESSFTELENLTELHNDSGLLLPHQSRHTKTGFLVQGGLLNDYVPTPLSKRPKGSWVWKGGHGEAIASTTTGESYWLCKACYNQPQKQVIVYPLRPTTGPQRHMEKNGYQLDSTKMVVKRKADDTQLTQ